jgi:hypothetical protein
MNDSALVLGTLKSKPNLSQSLKGLGQTETTLQSSRKAIYKLLWKYRDWEGLKYP